MRTETSTLPKTDPLPLALLVHEEGVWAAVLCRYLEARGYDVTWMTRAQGAISFVLDLEPELILLGWEMQGQNPELVNALVRLGEDTVARSAILTGTARPPRDCSPLRLIHRADLPALGRWAEGVSRVPASDSLREIP